ncbi:hypothetical protein [Nocardia sp. NPDC046763]|uniref:hypothetical protein n=1 Tax=Nocardia sp. NPDC046763 TaxID=3155256 RepID=UPI00340001FB
MPNYTATLPAQSAGGATSTTIICSTAPTDAAGVGITSVALTSPSAVTGAATNNATINVRQLRNGTPIAGSPIATLTLAAGTNLAAEVPVALAITLGSYVQPGDVLDVQLVQNGTGLALPAGLVVSIVVA